MHNLEEAEKANLEFWDEIASVHFKSYKEVQKLRKGGIALDEIQIKEVGDVENKKFLHLQCHIGTDTLSWARKGANVTGVDFSKKSIDYAKILKRELGLKARFLVSNVYDLKNKLTERFDIVYTSQGVLCWLNDLVNWAKIINHFLKPGGIFYIMETHPILYIFDDLKKGKLDIIHSYFHKTKPIVWDDDYPDYSDSTYISKNPTYEWTWSVSDIINSLLETGLEILFFNEYDKIFYKPLPDMRKDKEGWWYLPDYLTKLPLIFTLKAKKKPDL